jgi:hypothetical protein
MNWTLVFSSLVLILTINPCYPCGSVDPCNPPLGPGVTPTHVCGYGYKWVRVWVGSEIPMGDPCSSLQPNGPVEAILLLMLFLLVMAQQYWCSETLGQHN